MRVCARGPSCAGRDKEGKEKGKRKENIYIGGPEYEYCGRPVGRGPPSSLVTERGEKKVGPSSSFFLFVSIIFSFLRLGENRWYIVPFFFHSIPLCRAVIRGNVALHFSSSGANPKARAKGGGMGGRHQQSAKSEIEFKPPFPFP